MNNGGGNRGACLCKFPRTVISFMLNGQNSGAASENNLPPLFSLSTLLLALLCLASPPHRCSLCTHLLPAFIKREAERSESVKEYRSRYLPNPFSPDSKSAAALPETPEFYTPLSWRCRAASSLLLLHRFCLFLLFFYAFHLHFYCFIACLRLYLLSPP